MNKAAILIPTVKGREHFLERLLLILDPQIQNYNLSAGYEAVRRFILPDEEGQPKQTTGWKRNKLIDMALEWEATHRAFVDDDDTVSDDYIEINMPGVIQGYDCNSLIGIISFDGVINPKKHIFKHSLRYDRWYEDKEFYYRNPNHLNFVSLEKTKQIRFEDKNFGEDGCWSVELAKQGVLKTEYVIDKPFYNYLVRKNKTV